MTSGNREIDRN